MAESTVAIANRALQKLGAQRISAMDQNHPNARSMNNCYATLRRRLLRRYTWSFAIARQVIAADSDQTAFGDLNRYAKPNDFLRLIRDNDTHTRQDWKIEGRYVVSANGSPINLRYVADISDPTFFDAAFDEALACYMALECCEEITGSSAKKSIVAGELSAAIADAKNDNAMEGDPIEPLEDDFILAML